MKSIQVLGSTEGTIVPTDCNPLRTYIGEFARVRQVATWRDKETGQIVPGLTPFSVPTVWRKVAKRTFPAPIKLSAGVTAWRVSEIRDWLSDRQAENPTSASVKKNPVPRRAGGETWLAGNSKAAA